MKVTNLIFGIILMSLVMASFGLLISDMSKTYDVDYDNSTMSLYNQLNNTEAQAELLQTKINSSSTTSGILDIVGDFIGKAVDSLKLTYNSLGSAVIMTETATEDLGLPGIYRTALVTILVIFLIIGVILSAMIKKDL